MKNVNIKHANIILLLSSLTACSSNYQAFDSRYSKPYGFSEVRLNNDETPARYALTYKGKSSDRKTLITQYWHQRAAALCPVGYQVINHKQTIIPGTMRTPVNGMMVTVGTETPIDKGEIQCNNTNL